MKIPKIFISHSHEDETWKNEFLHHLRALELQGMADVWDTSDIPAGAKWDKQIKKAIEESDIAVLLISPSFLASDFIVNRELPELLRRRGEQGLVILPVMIRPSMWSAVPQLAELQFLTDPSRPIATVSASERDQVYAEMSRKIAELSQAVGQRKTPTTTSGIKKRSRLAWASSSKVSKNKHFFISHCKEDGDFAELLKLRLEREGLEAWIDTDRLDPGLDWRVEIDDGIKNAAALIAVMSPDARSSEYVTYEWAFAWGRDIKVIPIMLRQTTLHPRLATLQYMDFTNRIARPWSRLVGVLNGVEGKDSTPTEG